MGEPHDIVQDAAIVDLRTELYALYEAVDALTARIEDFSQKGEKVTSDVKVTSNLREYNKVYQQGLRAGRREGARILRHDPGVDGLTHKQVLDRIKNAPFEDLVFLEILSDLVERRIRELNRHSKV
jgi:hypothetical protein